MKTQAPAANAIIVGGGALVDALRELDRVHRLSAEQSHWLAIGAMSLTAELLADVLPEAALVRSAEDLESAEQGGLRIFDVGAFLRSDAATCGALPASWDVTSDSIAARAAVALGASELVLLKSALPEGGAALEALSAAGYVDRYFPTAIGQLVVRAVNLRDGEFAELVWPAARRSAGGPR